MSQAGRSTTLRQALLEAGLNVRTIKERLARHSADGDAAADSVPRVLWEALSAPAEVAPPRAVAAPGPPVDPRAAAIAARLEHTRLLLLRAALRTEPYEALSVPLAASSSAGGLRFFLGLQPMPQEAEAELTRLERALAVPHEGPVGERLLAERLGLSTVELQVIWLLAAPEVASRYQWVVDRLYGARTEGAVTRAFLRHVLGESPELDAGLSARGRLARYGLLLDAGAGRVRLSPRVLDLLLGVDGARDHELVGVATRHPVSSTAPALAGAAEATLASLRALDVRRFLVSGTEGAGVRSLAHIVARELGCPEVIEADVRPLAEAGAAMLSSLIRETCLAGAVLVLRHAEAVDGERFTYLQRAELVEALREERFPLVVDVGTSDSLQVMLLFGATLGASRVDLDLPPPTERAALWDWVLGNEGVSGEAQAEMTAAVRAFPLGVDHMSEALRLARASEPTLSTESLRAACDRLVTHRLGEYAVKVKTRARWDDLIVPDEIGDQIVDFLQHARLSRHVLDDLGYGKRLAYGRGLSALLSGASGTGKTMAATLIAEDLGIELYRVDLANIVSKYIGETEQRIAAVFREAVATGAALLFDEADSLFGKRTDVKSSNDRYANLEVNFLLQKLEEHDGISLLTTNFAGSIDKAFLRRIRFHVEFPEPDAAGREALWRSMIPEQAPREQDLGLAALAERYKLAGGAIRNAVLRAAFRAAGDERPLSHGDLDHAARAEMKAMGRLEWERP